MTGERKPLIDPSDKDWPHELATQVERYVGTVRSNVTGPVLTVTRYVVYGTALALIGMVLAVLALIALVRVTVAATAYAPFLEPGETWLAYYILGGIFAAVGIVLWRKKESPIV